jgi:hypothetical protein
MLVQQKRWEWSVQICIQERKGGNNIQKLFSTAARSGKGLCKRSQENQTLDFWKKWQPNTKQFLGRYLHSHGYPQGNIDSCQTSLSNNLKLSTLLLTSNKDIGVHRDPMAPCPACIFGHTTHTLENNTWSNKDKGGILFILDGLFALDYGPCDIVIIDGNIAHGVTQVQRVNVKGVTKRFSAIIFCTWNREQEKGNVQT